GAGGNDAEAARSEEDLSNLQQEKAYLDEQIRELEARVEANRTGEPGEEGIADTGL
ncbi:MAG: hypothetical protein GWO24_16085, partial [Akkermansiaceae bacterium]|nr:hypothetical protein [Akkermansiaceae bacterium]